MALKARLVRFSLAFLSFVSILGSVLGITRAAASVSRGGKQPASADVTSRRLPVCAAPQQEASDPQTSTSFVGVLTWHNDNARDGQNLNETLLTPANVNSTTFGKLFTRSVDGQVYAQPLYVPNVTISGTTHNVVYVATENDSVYAFDADGTTASPLWHTSFLNPARGVTTIPSSDSGCPLIEPQMGITGTPVIDPVSKTLYVVAATKSKGSDSMQLHALDITTGLDKFTPVTISASVNGVTFKPNYQLQRAALLLSNGTVYIGFGSHCDFSSYNGWLMAYTAATLAQSSVFLVTPRGAYGSIWNAGAGPTADSSGTIVVTTGNGTFSASTGGKDYGDSFVKLSPTLSVLDYFTPFNQMHLNSADLDLGSSGVVLLPAQAGAHPHIMVSAGKEGRIYVVNRDSLGHFHAGSDSQIVQSISGAFPNGLYTTAAYWNGHVYFAADGDVLKDYTLTNGLLSKFPAKTGPYNVPSPGSTPVVSANGTSNAIVWTLEDPASGATLRAHNATDITRMLYDGAGVVSSAGVRFAVPTVANGKVYIGTATELVVFGLL